MRDFKVVVLMSVFLVCVPGVCVVVSAGPPVDIELEEIASLKSPLPGGGGSSNSYWLPVVAADGPCIAIPWATTYENCTIAFYNAQLEEIALWRAPNGDKIMNVTAGDLDRDGTPEIVMTRRMHDAGVTVVRWDNDRRVLDPVWSYLAGADGPYYRGTDVGNFSDRPGWEVTFGNSKGMLYLMDKDGKLLAEQRLPCHKTIQRIHAVDVDGDGYHEMVISTGRRPGQVHLVRWDPRDHSLDVRWSTEVTAGGRGGDNCYESLYHPRGHPQGGGAIAAITEQETGIKRGAVALVDLEGKILWQHFFALEEGRAGGGGFADMTGDGVPEIITRTSSDTMHGAFVYDNQGHRLAHLANCAASSAGPCIADVGPDRPLMLLTTTYAYTIRVDGVVVKGAP